jgi:hypothetical protein
MIPLSKVLGAAHTGPTLVAVSSWDGDGIRPSFGETKRLPVEEKDETMIQSEDSLTALVAQNKNGLTRGAEAERVLGEQKSYYQSQSEYLF